MHPAHLVTRHEMMALELFDIFRGGGMAHGPLPFAGGWAEQPAALIAAFGVIAETEKKLKGKGKD